MPLQWRVTPTKVAPTKKARRREHFWLGFTKDDLPGQYRTHRKGFSVFVIEGVAFMAVNFKLVVLSHQL